MKNKKTLKTFKIDITELYVGNIDVEARNKREARKLFWGKVINETDMGNVMDASEGFKIKKITEVGECIVCWNGSRNCYEHNKIAD